MRGNHQARRGLWVLAALLAAVTGCSSSAAVSPEAATSPASPQPTPSLPPGGALFFHGSILSGLAVASARDAWAVGSIPTARNGATVESGSACLIEHWNGKAWGQVACPPIGKDNSLAAVTATSARNAWAVGSWANTRTLVLHWNGTAWQQQASPAGGVLTGVAADAAGDAWAVGQTVNGRPLILRLQSGQWQTVSVPPLANTLLEGVAVASGTDAWAVGVSAGRPVILHWNGTAWGAAPCPDPAGGGVLESVSEIPGGGAAWAVGASFAAPGHTLILHWNGVSWTRVTSPTPAGGAALEGVTATGARAGWAVGSALGSPGKTLILRWDGTAWKLLPSPDPGPASGTDTLVRVAAVAGGTAWAIGYESGVGPVIARWNGTKWVAGR